MYVYEFGFWDGRKGADPEVRERGRGLVNQDRRDLDGKEKVLASLPVQAGRRSFRN